MAPTAPFALDRKTILWVSEYTYQQTHRQTARRTWVDKHTNKQTDRQTAGQTWVDERTNQQTDRQTAGQTVEKLLYRLGLGAHFLLKHFSDCM